MKKSIFILVMLIIAIALPIITNAYTYSVSAEIDGANEWTSGIYPAYCQTRLGINDYRTTTRADYGTLNICIYGTWEGTVTLQKILPGGSEWIDTGDTWTENDCGKRILDTEPGVRYRIGIATDDYTSGSVNVRLSW